MDEELLLKIVLGQLNVRADANETAVLLRQLEHIKTTTYDIQYGPNKARQFIPVDNSADPGTESITYRQWDEFSMAKVIANYADDLPLVDVAVNEFTAPVKSLGTGYQWTIQDLRRALTAGVSLTDRRSRAARMAIMRAEDEIGAFGLASSGLPGFLNAAAVPITVLPNLGAWTGLTPVQIIANLNTMAQAIITNTLEVFTPDTILLDTVSFGHISQTPVGTDNQTTILRSFLQNNPYISNIDQWSKLNTAGAGSIRRSVTYFRDPVVVQWNIPQEFEQFPPQARNLSFVVPAHSRVGGVEIHYPLAMSYSDIAL